MDFQQLLTIYCRECHKVIIFTDLDKEEDFILLTIGAGDIDLWVNDI